MTTYEVDIARRTLTPGPWKLLNIESGESRLIPIPPPLCGVVIATPSSLTYHNGVAAKVCGGGGGGARSALARVDVLLGPPSARARAGAAGRDPSDDDRGGGPC